MPRVFNISICLAGVPTSQINCILLKTKKKHTDLKSLTMKAEKIDFIHHNFMVVLHYVFCALIFAITITNSAGVLATTSVLVSSDSQVYINSTSGTDGNDSQVQQHPQLRNVLPDSFFCGPVIGSHYMFGSASTYCGGFAVTDCSAQCFYRNFTYFQCEGFVCHCYSR